MQLDKTELVIRQRSALEVLDLSLLVFRRHWRPIVITGSLLGVPLLVADVLATRWMLNEDSYLVAENLAEPSLAMRWRHIFHILLLFVVQFQIASLPTTVFLGNQIFYEPMPLRKLVRRLWPIAWRCVLVLGIVRLGLVSLLLEFFVDRSVVFDWAAEFWLLVVVSGLALVLRAGWPFAPEILGLELCPLRSGRGGDITYTKRSRGLHKLLMADHVSRFIGSVVCGLLLTLMLLGTISFAKGTSTGNWMWNDWFNYFWLPLTMWIVGLFLSVFRFLSYLDSRIRLEGWEIDLRLRAEADRFMKSQRTQTQSVGIIATENQVPHMVEQ